LGATEAERQRRENRGDEGVRIGKRVPLPNRLKGLGKRRELPQQGPGRNPGRQRIFGIFEAYRTLLVERTVLLY